VAGSHRAVRDVLREDRISCARIRAALARECALGQWSTGLTDAIRPARLAVLLRRHIWRAHDVSLSAVERRLGQEKNEIAFEVRVEIDVGRAAPLQVRSLTHFSRSRHGRIGVRIDLYIDDRATAVTPTLLL